MSNEMPMQQVSDKSDVAHAAQRLERIITAACRAQPLLPAPASLHSRVMAAIGQHADRWWRAPLRVWPLWAQATLVLLCLCSTWLLTGGTAFGGNDARLQQWLFMPWALADIFASLLSVLNELLWLVWRISPVLWLLAVTSSGVAVAMGVMGLNHLTSRKS